MAALAKLFPKKLPAESEGGSGVGGVVLSLWMDARGVGEEGAMQSKNNFSSSLIWPVFKF
jgi:hypothetical protein